MKFAVSFFTLLLFIISGLLFFQYQVYSDKLEEGLGEFTYTQEIEIEYRDNSLDIRHHFKNLPNQTIEIKWPYFATNSDCFLESEQTCERLSKDKSKFEVGDSRTQSLSYVIPLDGGLQSNQLINSLFVKLNNGNVTYTTIHITTDSQLSGQWITGLPLIGQQSLSLVNYVMFSGQGDVNDIYYQSGNFDLQYQTDLISIYSQATIDAQLKDQLKNIQFLNDEHVSIVTGHHLSTQQGDRILFLDDLSLDGINKGIIFSQVSILYDFDNSPSWVKEVLASFITGSISGGSKATQLVNELIEHMSDRQLENWVQRLKDLQGAKITPAILDDQLSQVFAMDTEFFVLNEKSDGIYPLMFTDARNLIVNKNITNKVKLVYQNGLLYYSANDMLELLGYQVSEGSNGYYVDSELRKFRFPDSHNFYVFNQRRYDTISKPIVNIMEERYIEESWLQRLFLVEIEKTNVEIKITPNTTLQ